MKHWFIYSSLILLSTACASRNAVEVTVTNSSEIDRDGEVVQVPVNILGQRLGAEYFYVTDETGKELPSQITYDGFLIFPATVSAGDVAKYSIMPSDTLRSYHVITTGRVYPERADDLSWENDKAGFRAYGPATQKKGERGFGYDIFLKHDVGRPIIDEIIATHLDPANKAKVDSLKKIDPEKATEFSHSISYHWDNGLGMDCYAVGPTLGAGTAALVENDSIFYPWCWDNVEILDNGPLRFTADLTFTPATVGTDTAVIEHRLISIDAGTFLNNCKVSYEGLTKPYSIVAGIPLRDEMAPMMDAEEGWIAYSDPLQREGNGRAQLGVLFPQGVDSVKVAHGHVLGYASFEPTDTLEYLFGFSWDKENIPDMEEWSKYLSGVATSAPLTVEF